MADTDVINNKSAIIKSNLNEYTKAKQFLDVSGRLEYLYQAHIDAVTGTPCYVARYSYYGTTSVVEYTKEYQGTWDVSWETF